ncbi:uncharacterized protein [Ptychodera flava]|uniref:uncharacterized protein n=1 Tax=Ptychodera flava TaxID=63121 RepID=UPI00396A9A9D
MADNGDTTLRRSQRSRQMPAYLADYDLGDDVEQEEKLVTHWDRLIKERGLMLVDINRHCEKADKLIKDCGSRTTLEKVNARLERSLADLERLACDLVRLAETSEYPEEEKFKVTQHFTVTKAQVEDYQDKIAEHLHARDKETSSTVGSPAAERKRECQSQTTLSETKEQKYSEQTLLPQNSEFEVKQEDESMSDHKSVSSHASVKSAAAKIQAEVATLRVKQEKKRYEEECNLRAEEENLRQAEHRLQLQKEQDEADRVALEAELWDGLSNNQYIAPPFKPGLSTNKAMKEGTSRIKVKTEAHFDSPIAKHLESLFTEPKVKYDTPHIDTSKESSEYVHKFFQGIAKPSLPRFSGEKEQYQDWREQFEIFINQAQSTVRFKMVMLKSSLSGRALQLVSRLGYNDHQYQMALTKLDQRYGAKLADSGRESELIGPSTLYTLVLQKIPESLVLQYYDSRPKLREDGLSTFVDWLNRQVCVRLELAEIKEKAKRSYTESAKSSGTRRSQRSGTHASETSSKSPKASQVSSTSPSKDSSTTKLSCPLCKEAHHIVQCRQWNSFSVDERWKFAKENGLCYRCLKVGHHGRKCADVLRCKIDGCVKTHHRHLHKSEPATEIATDTANNAFGVSKDGKVIPTKVALRLIPVFIIGRAGDKKKVNAFLDDGSDSTYIRKDIATALGLQIEDNELTVSTLVNRGTKVDSGLVAVTIESLDGRVRQRIGARTLNSMCDNLSIPNWRRHGREWSHLKGIDFPKIPGRKTVDILIGADHPELTLSLEERAGCPGEPVARKTPLGWTCIGVYHKGGVLSHTSHVSSFHSQSEQDVGLNEALRNMWNLDSWESKKRNVLTPEERLAVSKTAGSLKQVGNRYEIGIPWRDERPELPDNRKAAENRLLSLERTLSKKPALATRYREVMQANIKKGYFETVDGTEGTGPGWYLPHFPVVREDKATTKVRIVYDSAARTEGVSLNDVMLPGPKLQLDVVDVLLRFRRRRIAIVGDIKEMFSQIVMAKEDRPYHRILWRDLDTSRPVTVYQAARLTFGDCASPYLAQYVIRTHAESNQEKFPLAATICTESMYMDDVMDSQDDDNVAIQARDQLSGLLAPAGFQVRRWCSNSTAVLEGIPEDKCATGVKVKE